MARLTETQLSDALEDLKDSGEVVEVTINDDGERVWGLSKWGGWLASLDSLHRVGEERHRRTVEEAGGLL